MPVLNVSVDECSKGTHGILINGNVTIAVKQLSHNFSIVVLFVHYDDVAAFIGFSYDNVRVSPKFIECHSQVV